VRARTRGSAPARVTILNWRDPWHPEGGGSELYVQQVAERLRDGGTQVTWVTAAYPDASGDEVVDGIRYVRRGGHISVYLWVAWLILTGRVGRPDAVLEVQNGMPFLATWLTRKPVVVLVHHVHREQWSVVGPLLARVGWFLESRVAVRANRGNRYIAVSDVTRRELTELGVRAKDIEIAHNGTPPEPAYVPRPRSTEPTLVVLSRLVPHKRIEHAIAALPALAQEFPDVRLRVMGDGWWADQLHACAAERGVTDRVTFLGHVDERTKYEELSAAWLHLMPSIKEGWGLSIIEAARVGVPSIAYADAGGVAESILDGVTGLLAHDEADFVARTAQLLADPSRLHDMGLKARGRTEEFTWDAAAACIGAALSD
jgi:glycosyltransferase involved in cell wall biosynthesis